jgi:hypothetical protein
MKKLLVLMIAASFSLQAAPFYKVKCYDSNNKLVSCDEVARANAAKAQKVAKAKKKVKKETLAQKKARERAIALRDIAKQNDELKREIEALRKATLLAAAKTEEQPAQTAVLAAPTQTVVPTAQAEVTKDTVTDNPNKWAFSIANTVEKSMKADTPLTNGLDLDLFYNATDHMQLGVEQSFSWNWTTTTNAPTTSFSFVDLLLMFNYSKIFQSDDKVNTLDGDINTYLATTKGTRDEGQLANIRLRLKFKRSFNDSKGSIGFQPAFTWFVNKATTTAPTGDLTKYEQFGDDQFEKLSPGTNYVVGLKSIFNHKLMDSVTFETYVNLKSTRKHADEALGSQGNLVTVTPAEWQNTIEIALPKIVVSVSERFNIEALLKTTTSFSNFKLYNTSPDNTSSNTALSFRLSYDI